MTVLPSRTDGCRYSSLMRSPFALLLLWVTTCCWLAGPIKAQQTLQSSSDQTMSCVRYGLAQNGTRCCETCASELADSCTAQLGGGVVAFPSGSYTCTEALINYFAGRAPAKPSSAAAEHTTQVLLGMAIIVATSF